jgi:exosortase/archaeosortase family protein
LRAPGGGLNILNGCEGMEAVFLLLAAFVVAPLSWRCSAMGVLIGVGFVYAINQVRILALFFAYRADPRLFYTLHTTVTPIAAVLLVAAYFYLWMLYANPRLAKSR